MKIMIAVPCMSSVPVDFTESILDLHKPEGTRVCFKKNSLVYDARNLLSLHAIEQNFDYVFWMDSDMVVPPDTLTKLINHASAGYDMITGLYFKRTIPTLPVIYDELNSPAQDEDGHIIRRIHEYTDYPQNALFPVEGCGFGCVLTSVSLLKTVWDKFGPAFSPYPWAGEDLSFCYRAKQTGIRMYCDSTIQCGHVGNIVFTEHMYRRPGGDNT